MPEPNDQSDVHGTDPGVAADHRHDGAAEDESGG
jgi:hypothetical protein